MNTGHRAEHDVKVLASTFYGTLRSVRVIALGLLVIAVVNYVSGRRNPRTTPQAHLLAGVGGLALAVAALVGLLIFGPSLQGVLLVVGTLALGLGALDLRRRNRALVADRLDQAESS